MGHSCKNNKSRDKQRDTKYKQRNKQRDTTADVGASRSNKEAARSAVFDTTELLENIVSFLPPADILAKAQRVSRAWHDVVTKSPKIQTKLWMMPKAAKPIAPLGAIRPFLTLTYNSSWSSQNPTIRSPSDKANPDAFFADGCVSTPATIGGVSLLAVTYDAVKVLFDGLALDQTIRQTRQTKQTKQTRQSWLNMDLTEPPITVAQVEVTWPVEQGDDVVLKSRYATKQA